jgi:hypothetical protein
MMKKPITYILIGTIVIFLQTAHAEDREVFRFEGEGNRTLPEFTVDGPWTLDWSARAEFFRLASIEMRLYDGESGDFIGSIAELKGIGQGYKLFEDPGSYQIRVVATGVEWEITVEEISEERAASLKREAEGPPDFSTQAKSRVPVDSFASWRPEGNEALFLFEDGNYGWRVTFRPAVCPGLSSATALSFVTPGADPSEGYDSIMLDDGTRCYFESVTSRFAK